MQYKYMLPICYIFTADNSTILMVVMMYVTMAKWEETNKLIFRYHIYPDVISIYVPTSSKISFTEIISTRK